MNFLQNFWEQRKLVLLLGLFIGILMVFFSWVGWMGSDDARHIDGALGWYKEFPYLPIHHGEFRHLITLPAAFSFSLFGISEYSAVLPILIYYFCILAFTLLEVQKRFDGPTALLSILLIASMSIFSLRATVVYSDIVEAFFVTLSFWLFLRSCNKSNNRVLLLFIAGTLAGAGWLTRETTVALLLIYGLLFIVGFGIPRRYYWIMAIGFLLVLFADSLFFWAQTGNPFYRYVEIFTARTGFISMQPQSGQLFNDIGNVQLTPLIDPVIALLINHEMGILFYLTPFVAFGLWRDKQMDPEKRKLALLFLFFGLTWFLVTSIAVTRYHPRYFTVTSYCVALATATWLIHVVRPHRPKMALSLAFTVISIACAGIYVENRNPIFGARSFADIAADTDQIIHTDPETYRRSYLLLLSNGSVKNASFEQPIPGDLYLYNPNRIDEDKSRCRWRPAKDWQQLKVIEEEPKLIAILLKASGHIGILHPSIERRLVKPNADVQLFRVGRESICSR